MQAIKLAVYFEMLEILPHMLSLGPLPIQPSTLHLIDAACND